jgi:hypothetical protein
MTTLGKILLVAVAVGLVIGATVMYRPQPEPAVERVQLTHSQVTDLQQTKAPERKPVERVVPPAPSDDDAEDGNGS